MHARTEPSYFWMQMQVDKARTLVSVARTLGYSIWLDDNVRRVRIWPEPLHALILGQETKPYWLRLSERNVAVFTDEVGDFSPVWQSVELRIRKGGAE